MKPTTSPGATSASVPPTFSTSVAFDGTLGARPTRTYSRPKPTIDTKNATPSSVKRMVNLRLTMTCILAIEYI